jgi:alpha-N-acetylglucosamine transferase
MITTALPTIQNHSSERLKLPMLSSDVYNAAYKQQKAMGAAAKDPNYNGHLENWSLCAKRGSKV